MQEQIDRYEIRGLLGEGGMAKVYRAYDPRFPREVALKTMPAGYLGDPQFRQRFEREAAIIARLQHPGIVPVHDFGEEDGRLFLVMRLMEGGSLQERLDGRPVSLRVVAKLFNGLASALDAAHSKGIVHRDLKPGNILFDEWDEPYLTDFGIVKILEDNETALTKTGGILGTPAYMSPEQVQGEDIDGRSDIYALGVILYEMLTGVQPYQANTPFSVAVKHINEPVPLILEANEELPLEMQVVIARTMAKDREDRYPTARALAAELDALVRDNDKAVDTAAVAAAGRTIGDAAEEIPVPQVEVDQIESEHIEPAVDEEVTLLDTPAEGLDGATMIDATPQPKPPLAVENREEADRKTAVPRWMWIAGGIIVIMLLIGLLWAFGRGGDGNQPLADDGGDLAAAVAASITETPLLPATRTKRPAETPTSELSQTPTSKATPLAEEENRPSVSVAEAVDNVDLAIVICRNDDILCIGLVTDVGKVDDKSFNQSTWEGVQQAASELGAQVEFIETEDVEDYGANIALFANDGYDLIVTVGFAMGEATAVAAHKYPDVDFIGVDQFQGERINNLAGLIFNEDEAGFLAGALAGMLTETDTVAAVLGTDMVSPVVAFKEGYEGGTKYVNPDINLISTYHPGGMDVAFTDPEWGAETARQALDQGADVIFAAAGTTGNGSLLETAGTMGTFCIGVDIDQWFTFPEARPCLVSSAMKLIAEGVFDLAEMSFNDDFPSGNFLGPTGLAPFHDFDGTVPQDVKDRLVEIDAGLQDGSIQTGYRRGG